MAMYENEGFCPNNSFLHYKLENAEKIPEIWNRTEELLGDRIGYMVYTPSGFSYYGSWSNIVDCLIGSTSTLGVEVACKLQVLIPNCKYAETGRKILLTDVINPFQIPGIQSCFHDNTEHFVGSDGLYVVEDERYLVGVVDEGTAVHLYLFKKERTAE